MIELSLIPSWALALGSLGVVLFIVLNIVGLIILYSILMDVWHRKDLSKKEKVFWMVAILLIPYVGFIVYLVDRRWDIV